MPTEIGWRPANGLDGGFDPVNDENPLPVQLVRPQPFFPQPFTYPLAGSVSILVRNAGASLRSVTATSINASLRYLQIFNQRTAPATGDTPVLVFPLPAGSATNPGYVSVTAADLGDDGLQATTGLAIGVSTTAATFTAATATDHIVSGMVL